MVIATEVVRSQNKIVALLYYLILLTKSCIILLPTSVVREVLRINKISTYLATALQ